MEIIIPKILDLNFYSQVTFASVMLMQILYVIL